MLNYIDTVLNNQDYCLYKHINSLGYFPSESTLKACVGWISESMETAFGLIPTEYWSLVYINGISDHIR